MTWRFWEDPSVMPMANVGRLAPRRMDLTELQAFSEDLATSVGADKAGYRIRTSWDSQVDLHWTDLVKMLPDQLSTVFVEAMQPEALRPAPPAMAAQAQFYPGQQQGVILNLNGTADAEGDRERLRARWEQLGRPRRSWWAVYPAALVAVLLGALAPMVVLWARRDLSLWTIPVVVVGVVAAFLTAVPHVRRLVARHRSKRAGLVINYGFREQVLREQAARRLALWSGLGGAALGAIVTAVVGWVTVVNQR